MKIETIKAAVRQIAGHYPVSRVTLFGSQASGKASDTSDIDLIVEFSAPVTLITLARMQQELEEALGKDVDLIHGPMRSDDMIEVQQQVVLYAA